jgi:MoaA/NifB/PqqE/SkfB family radical SAM enzyme
MYDFNKAFSFHIELTDKCNARCIQCSRNIVENGNLKQHPKLCLVEITIDQYKKIFQNYLKQAKSVLFCGNMGDPVFAKDIFEITKHTVEEVLTPHGMFKNYTNGGMKSPKWWKEYGNLLKDKRHLINFAIDGLEDTHHLYRTNTRYHRVIENARAFMEGGGKAEWSFIRFGHNQHQEEEARRLAKEYGFEQFTAVNTQRFYGREEMKYKWQNKDYSIKRYKPETYNLPELGADKLDRTSKKWAGKSVNELTADEINVNTQKSLDKFVKNRDNATRDSKGSIDCHVQRRNDVFIDCMGYVHPCCWIGSYEYHKINGLLPRHSNNRIDNELLDYRDYKKAWEVDFKDILKEDWYEYIMPASWDVKPCMICARQCGKGKFTTIRQSNRV